MHKVLKFWNATGPIILSALSVLSVFLILQPIATALDQSFNLLSSRDFGKITFITIIISTIILFVLIQPKSFLNKFLEKSLFFFKKKIWLKEFFSYFSVFFILHLLILGLCLGAGHIQLNPNYDTVTIKLLLKTLFGFVTVFFLAWSEETIFRGLIYQYWNRSYSKFISITMTSLLFALVHDLRNPLNLVTKNWRLGLGLFLLGMMLNLIFVHTKKLQTGMGAHAGLVFVKVLQRRFHFIEYLPASKTSFWFSFDLRQSFLTHFLFLIAILILVYKNKKQLFKRLS